MLEHMLYKSSASLHISAVHATDSSSCQGSIVSVTCQAYVRACVLVQSSDGHGPHDHV